MQHGVRKLELDGLAGREDAAAFDDLAQSWSGPFVMAPINTKNVHRTHALRGHPWGTDFIYSERLLTGSGEGGEKRAKALARNTRLQNALLACVGC